MLFKEIPQFTSWGSYHVDLSFNYLENWIEDHMKWKLELNPDFQRGHVWDEAKQIAYVEYAYRGGMSGREVYFNMAGWMQNYNGDFVLVDGLQRITAVRRFFNKEIKIFNQYVDEFGEILYRAMNPSFSVHINNLQTRKEVLNWYLELNTGGVVHTSEEIERVKKLLEKEI
jgi:hypothetical protein